MGWVTALSRSFCFTFLSRGALLEHWLTPTVLTQTPRLLRNASKAVVILGRLCPALCRDELGSPRAATALALVGFVKSANGL